jgi:hypothetical protein
MQAHRLAELSDFDPALTTARIGRPIPGERSVDLQGVVDPTPRSWRAAQP